MPYDVSLMILVYRSPKIVPGQLIDTEWMKKEINKIKELYENNRLFFQIRFVYRDLPDSECSKDYYMDKIQELFTNAQDGGEEKIYFLNTYELHCSYNLVHWSRREGYW